MLFPRFGEADPQPRRFAFAGAFLRLGASTAMDPRFAHIRDWIFDLDNCLYPAGSRLFELIESA